MLYSVYILSVVDILPMEMTKSQHLIEFSF